MKTLKIPKDLGIKIGTKEEQFWTDFKTKCEDEILNSERVIKINKHLIELSDEKIKEEKEL